MKRPVFWLVLFFIAGILAGQSIFSKIGLALFFCAVFIAAILLLKKFKIMEPIIFPLFTVVGILCIQGAFIPKYPEVTNAAEAGKLEVTLEGYLAEQTETKRGGTCVVLDCFSMESSQFSIQDNFKIQIYFDELFSLPAGSKLSIEAKLQNYQWEEQPGDFNEKLYYVTRGFDYKAKGQQYEYLEGETKKNLKYSLLNFRKEINTVYKVLLPKEEAGILMAIITGDRSGLTEDIKQAYRVAGIIHILAISGLHITLLGMAMFYGLKKLFYGKGNIAVMITILFLILYVIFAGAAPATVRAAIMTGMMLFGRLISRDRDSITSLCLAMLVLLLWQPLYLWDVGFQLSFTAAGSIILSNKMFPNKTIAVPILISFFIFPFLAYHYHIVTLAGIFINFLILPFVCIVVGCGVVAGILGLMFWPAVVPLLFVVQGILGFYRMICDIAAAIPFLQILIGRPSMVTIIFYYGLLCALCIFIKHRNKKTVVAAACCFIGFLGTAMIAGRTTEAAFFSVPKGNAIVITTNRKQTFVINGGGLYNRNQGENTGSMYLLPYLEYKGINSVDCLFITVFDSSHILGALELLEQIEVKEVMIPYMDKKNGYYRLLEMVSKAKGIPMYLSDGWDIYGEHQFQYFENESGDAGVAWKFGSMKMEIDDEKARMHLKEYEGNIDWSEGFVIISIDGEHFKINR